MAIPHIDTMYITCKYSDFMLLDAGQRQQIFDVACEKSMDTVRRTISGEDKMLLKFNKWTWKWKGVPPGQLSQLENYYDTFTRDEIIVELQKPEWIQEDI